MTALNDFHTVIVGCGRMGSALIAGAVAAGALEGDHVFCIDSSTDAAEALASTVGGHVGAPPTAATLWVLATKPHHIADALAPLEIRDGDIVVSVAAGIRIDAIKKLVPTGTSVVRAMPNTPALVGEGITGVLAPPNVADLADALFGAVGSVVHLDDEKHFDALTAVSGSGPAFVFVAIEALADGGVMMGLPRQMAIALATQTVLGAAALAKHETAHVAELKDRVASPGGTTIAGLAALEAAGFRTALIEAVRAATERSRELGE